MIEPRTSKTELQKRRFPLSTEGPFHTANNLHLFYGGGDRGAISEGIVQRLRKSPEPVVISGEPGSGKTMLSLVLADRLKRNYNVIRYEHAQVDSASLLRHLLIEISPQAAVALSRNLQESLEPSVQRPGFSKSKTIRGRLKRESTFAKEMSRDVVFDGVALGTSESDTQEQLEPDSAKRTPLDVQGLAARAQTHVQAKSLDSAVDKTTDKHLLESMFTSIRSTLEQGTPNNKPVLLILDARESPDQQCLNLLYRLAQTTNRFGNVFSVALFLTCDPPASPYANRKQHGASNAIDVVTSSADRAQDANDPRPDFMLRRLSLAEVSEYLQHHMLLFDFNKRDLFSRDMAYFIADRTDGNFKAINVLARNAFMLAGLECAQQMSMSHLLVAGLPQRPEKKQRWYKKGRKAQRLGVGMIGTGCVAIGALAVFVLL